MSRGHGAIAKLIDEDDNYYYFSYSCLNLNKENLKEFCDPLDGMIIVHKSYFPKPEIYYKRKKMPNKRRKVIEKKRYPESNFSELLEAEKIMIENTGNAWDIINGRDRMALKLIFKMRSKYEESGQIETMYHLFY